MPTSRPTDTAAADEVLAKLNNVDVAVTMPDGTTQQLLRGVHLRAEAGRCLALVGESGSGKTTLGRTIGGILPASMSTTGSIKVTSRVTYMFQDAMAALNPLRKVRWQVEEALRASGVPRAQRADVVLDYLSRCGLPDPERYARRYPHELSGGLAQRVLLATVLATGPALVIADEPTSALDVTTQAGIITLFRRLIDEDHLGMVLITHDLTVAAHLADEIAVMTGGRVVEQAAPRELFSNPIDPYTKRLVDALPRRSRTIAEEVAR